MATATSRGFAPNPNSARSSKSIDTVGSAASIFATRDWLGFKRFARLRGSLPLVGGSCFASSRLEIEIEELQGVATGCHALPRVQFVVDTHAAHPGPPHSA